MAQKIKASVKWLKLTFPAKKNKFQRQIKPGNDATFELIALPNCGIWCFSFNAAQAIFPRLVSLYILPDDNDSQTMNSQTVNYPGVSPLTILGAVSGA